MNLNDGVEPNRELLISAAAIPKVWQRLGYNMVYSQMYKGHCEGDFAQRLKAATAKKRQIGKNLMCPELTTFLPKYNWQKVTNI